MVEGAADAVDVVDGATLVDGVDAVVEVVDGAGTESGTVVDVVVEVPLPLPRPLSEPPPSCALTLWSEPGDASTGAHKTSIAEITTAAINERVPLPIEISSAVDRPALSTRGTASSSGRFLPK
ncbi:MAG: hypothetical protein OEX04_02375 [Acidimicrobiia bacterium]|nr:hypothetical protein [Acidimicrobiia bacterium]MDH4306300.1 hypothetical protein [Acidimicrobiia bacterium]MDH5292456.1 hypothetical protein [Acidimicrobiia bacterium]